MTDYFLAGAAAAGAAGAPAAGAAVPVKAANFPPCPLNLRVWAKAPSFWPTISSVMKTGRCCLPLCTAIVSPMQKCPPQNNKPHSLKSYDTDKINGKYRR